MKTLFWLKPKLFAQISLPNGQLTDYPAMQHSKVCDDKEPQTIIRKPKSRIFPDT